MTAGPQTLMMGLMGLALTLLLTPPETSSSGSSDIVRKESHPDLLRQKRDFRWRVIYVYEGRLDPQPYTIQVLKTHPGARVKRYHLEGEGANSTFTVDDKGRLFVTKTLDRKEKDLYRLTARMYDGTWSMQDEFIVEVCFNGSVPIFPTTYSGSIKERSRIGTEVVAVTATDADDPKILQGKLQYSLRPEGELSAFEIDSLTGVVRSRSASLDRETRSQYVLVVQAQDLDGEPAGHMATTSVTITITDINDNIASFTRRTYEFQIPEDLKLNETIGTLTLEDRDEIQNKDPIFTITPPFDDMFEVKLSPVKDGDFMLRQVLDYETRSSYSFTVHVWENNPETPADNADIAITSVQVNIKVNDVDEPPMFTRPIYNFSVMEETMITNIGAVRAKDPDKASKSIRYSIEDKDCPIGVNLTTGQLFTLRKLDRMLEATHTFQVRAQEEPSGLESFVKVNILVRDEVFVVPNFPTTYNRSIKERSRIGTEVVAVTATDADDPIVAIGALQYSLRAEGELSAFEIDSFTGVIRSRSDSLDRETRSQYVLVVQAQGLGGKTATTSVTVTITDINDNIASFTRRTYDFQVPEDLKLNETIGTLTLEDRDEIQNKDTIFTITPPFDDMFKVKLNLFKDGDFMLRQVLDNETRSRYSFTVHVWENNPEIPADNADIAITNAQVNIKVHKQRDVILKKVGVIVLIVLVCLSVILGMIMKWRRYKKSMARMKHNNEDIGKKMSNDQLVSNNREDGGDMSNNQLVSNNRQNGEEMGNNQLVANNGQDGGQMSNDQLVANNRGDGGEMSNNQLVGNNSEDGGEISNNQLVANDQKDGGEMSNDQLVANDREDGGEMEVDSYINDGGEMEVDRYMKYGGEMEVGRSSADHLSFSFSSREGLSTQTSATHDSSLLRYPAHSLHRLPHPACNSNMAVKIQEKKDKVDRGEDSFPHDTVRSYNYEGSGSLAGSLSSLESATSHSNSDFSFLKECGPKFQMLANMYGMDRSNGSDKSFPN